MYMERGDGGEEMIVYCDNGNCAYRRTGGEKGDFNVCMASDVTISTSDGEIECPGGQFPNVPDTNIGEWIPCSERLPEEHEWIGTKEFGTTISDEVNITFDVNGKRFVNVMHLQNGELSGSDKKGMDVFHKGWKMLAWMPLPEPWKGADDETNRR